MEIYVSIAVPKMRHVYIWMTILFALLFAQPAVSGDYDSYEKKAIAMVKATPTSEIEAGRPAQPFEVWLQNLAGKDAKLEWEFNDCGEGTGGPADEGRDMPLCVSVIAKLPDDRYLHVLLGIANASDMQRDHLPGSAGIRDVSAGYKNELFVSGSGPDPVLIKLEEFLKVDSRSIGLYYSAARGDVQTVQAMLKQGVDIHTSYGRDALVIAAQNGQIVVISQLLDAGADINVRLKHGETALAQAIWLGHVETVKFLLAKRMEAGLINEALIPAAMYGRLEIAQMLLKAGADVNYKDPKYHWTPLMWSYKDSHTDLARVFLDVGADVNSVSAFNQTALNDCAVKGSVDDLLLLLEHGANVRPKNAMSPLFSAVESGSIEKIRVLLDRGADINTTSFNHEGYSPLMNAAGGGNLKIVKLLVDKGADLNLHGKDGSTALSLATKYHHPQVAKMLREAGAKQ